MRNPGRIVPMLAALKHVWERDPDLRLGQIVVNAARCVKSVEACPEIFHIEDDRLLQGLRESESTQASNAHMYSLSSEKAVLGGLLLDNAAFDKISGIVSESDFYLQEHRRIFRHIHKRLHGGQSADALSVAESLACENEKPGLAGLTQLAADTPPTSDILQHAEILRDRTALRHLATAANEILNAVANPRGRNIRQLFDEAEARLFVVVEPARPRQGFRHIQPLLTQVAECIQEMHDRNDPFGLLTGFIDLDRMTSGLHAGELIVVGGCPGVGKTAFALNVAEHAAVELELPVAFFSLATDGAQLAARLLCSVGRIDARRFRAGRLTDDEWGRFAFALGKLYEAPLYIDEGTLNPISLRAHARRLYRQCGRLGLVVVDALQQMVPASPDDESRIVCSLKALAKELNVPLMLLSQLSRNLDGRPILSDLRESGAIEDADMVLFIHCDEGRPDTPNRTAEIIVGKLRNGSPGTVRLNFLGGCGRFENHTREPAKNA